jgi:tripartite-type tricarboxylate transporter receptor subunit TctC
VGEWRVASNFPFAIRHSPNSEKIAPPEIVDILNKAIGEALKDPKLVARLSEIGGIPKPMTPAEFGKLIADETEKWRKVVEFAGVSVD